MISETDFNETFSQSCSSGNNQPQLREHLASHGGDTRDLQPGLRSQVAWSEIRDSSHSHLITRSFTQQSETQKKTNFVLEEATHERLLEQVSRVSNQYFIIKELIGRWSRELQILSSHSIFPDKISLAVIRTQFCRFISSSAELDWFIPDQCPLCPVSTIQWWQRYAQLVILPQLFTNCDLHCL